MTLSSHEVTGNMVKRSCNNVAPVTNLCLGRVSEHLGFYY